VKRRGVTLYSSSVTHPSERLKKARLRLSEAQGRIPPGAADKISEDASLEVKIDFFPSPPASAYIRETALETFSRVAEPENRYDPMEAEKRLFRQPLRWATRLVELLFPLGGFFFRLLLDVQQGKEIERRHIRAKELQTIIAGLGPAIIKGGQALASRPDLLPSEYLEELQRLQDRLPPFPKEVAFAMVESELGVPFSEVFELVEPEPIAAASIGQVFKARLVANGDVVAIKIQRPGCEDVICVDLFIMRFYAGLLEATLRGAFGRSLSLVSVVDDFGDLIYREIDYQAEAANAQHFGDLYAGIPDVYIPRIYPDLSTQKVLTMEWVEGVRLVDEAKLKALELDSAALVDTLVQCSLRQMLDNGFYHADPHAGNLLATPEGKLCYLDFGMMSYVETSQRYAIIEAVVHLVNRDFEALTVLYQRMGFIPLDQDTGPIVAALEGALPDVLEAPVGELNIANVLNSLGNIMYEFPFSLPPFYISLIRCLAVLEGLAIQVQPEFRIVRDAYPYISSRLLTDPSPELEAALQQLLFEPSSGQARWGRLEQLLTQASRTADYDVGAAAHKFVDYLMSEKGAGVRAQLVDAVVQGADELADEAMDLIDYVLRTRSLPNSDTLKSPRLATAANIATALVGNPSSFDVERLLPFAQKLANEPASRQAGIDAAAAISERAISRGIRRLFQVENSSVN